MIKNSMAAGDDTISLATARGADGEYAIVRSAKGIFALAGLVGKSVEVLDVLRDWSDWQPRIAAALDTCDADAALEETALVYLSPIPRPPKIVCIGTNYHDHLREMGVTVAPEFPYAFLRPLTCLAGHREEVPMPSWPQFVDWEAELGIIVGKGGRNLTGETARRAIGGFTIINDISARDWIENRPWVGIDWVMQKGWDKFQPTGPWLVPAEYVPEPGNLAIELTVNGIVRQDSNTAEMIFDTVSIIEHLSRIMTLELGDIIATGTPAGVGFGQKPRIQLQRGDVMSVNIQGLGNLETTMV